MITNLPFLLRSPLGLALSATLMLNSSPARSHGGEDHGDAPHAVVAWAAQQAPRASTQTDSFELVAVLEASEPPQSPTLTIYLDQVDTNAPVEGASIDVESGAFKASAKPVAPGVYSVPAAALTRPGRHPLTFTVQSADTADLLDATLAVPPSQVHDLANMPQPHTATRVEALAGRWPLWVGSLFAMIALGLTWARRTRANHRQRLRLATDHPPHDATGQV